MSVGKYNDATQVKFKDMYTEMVGNDLPTQTNVSFAALSWLRLGPMSKTCVVDKCTFH